jgi:hypothetical protein
MNDLTPFQKLTHIGMLICNQYFPSFCMQKVTITDVGRSNTVKQFSRRSRVNSECKYILLLV